jgi:hypothetical protein
MKNIITICILICALLSCKNQTVLEQTQQTIQRGEYLITIGGCHDCHSPKIMTDKGPIPDTNRLFSGHPADEKLPAFDSVASKAWILFSLSGTSAHGPWGTSYAANITPDPTGIGSWTEDRFLNAMQKGYFHGLENNRMILPPMPWSTYSKMKKEDILAIFEYLKKSKPINNIVPEFTPPSN